jgi:DNA-binding PadR family transcriptional regulator
MVESPQDLHKRTPRCFLYQICSPYFYLSSGLNRSTLKGLEQDGLVKRTLYPTIPPRVDYELTDLGRTLVGSLKPLHAWAAKNKHAIVSLISALVALNNDEYRLPHGLYHEILDKVCIEA